MDYYVVINEQKQGPFDFLAIIKKVKNGAIKRDTLISIDNGVNFVPAGNINEISKVLASDGANSAALVSRDLKISFKNMLVEGVDLWTRKIINYTIFLGVIFVLGFGFSQGLKQIQVIADYSFIADYLTGVVCYTLLGLFFYYVLQSKRSQEGDFKDFQAVIMPSLLPLLAFAAIISLLNIIYTFSPASFIIATLISTIVFTIVAFVPFLITDLKMSLSRAVSTSLKQYRIVDKSCILTVFILIAMNTVTALVLAMISPNFMVIGLIITVPITVAALSYIYDQVFA